MIIAIDFDGTIVEHEYPEIGPLKPYAKEVINRICDLGHYVIIWTCRGWDGTLQQAIEFLNRNGIKFHKANQNADNIDFNAFPKIYADIYIDDRNLGGIPSWPDILTLITGEKI
jgi:hypothetical protein